jgi:hypothetical protein
MKPSVAIAVLAPSLFAMHFAATTSMAAPELHHRASVAVRLVIAEFCVDKTTEAGADEVYVLTMGRRSDGATFSSRSPSDAPGKAQGHWDMNDNKTLPKDNRNGDAHCRTEKTLFNGELEPGQSWDLNVLFMEEDGGTSKPFQELAAAIATSSGNPYAVAGGTVLAGITKLGGWIKDSDDYVGNFGVHIANDQGTIKVSWNGKERIATSNPDPSAKTEPRHREFRMNGDGANYVAWMQVR